MNTDHTTTPSADYPFFLYCPNEGTTFYRTEQERDDAAELTIEGYLDDGLWNEDVGQIYGGRVSHFIVEVDRKDRVGELDEDGYDEADEYWPDSDIDCKCGYALKPTPTEPPTDA